VPSITQPARLIHGRNDTVMPLPAAEWLAGHLPHARLDVLEACGHAPMISQPEACAQIIEEALRG
jgi:pimeloyl-[acyl-carrier protein] methyl ester esterase